MFLRWSVKRKLLICLFLLSCALTVLTVSGGHGIYSFRALTKVIRQRATELPAAPTKSSAARKEPAAATGPWRIQLGAFSQRSSAEALYKSLAGKAALAGRTPHYVAVGSVTRLQVGPFPSSAAAQAACAALSGQACFPTLAK